MSLRAASWLAWSLFAAWALLQVGAMVLVARGVSAHDEYFGLAMVGFAVVGAVLGSRRPGNPIGWLLLGIALALGAQVFAEVYVVTPTYPGRLVIAWIASWLWFVWLVLAGIVIPLLFPTGRLLSRRWRPAAWLAVSGLVASVVGAAFEPGNLALTTPIENPLGASGTAADLMRAVSLLGGGLVTAAFVLGGVSLAVRFRRAQGVERQQLKWFALVGLIMLTGLAVSAVAESFPGRWAEVLGGIGWSTFLFGFIAGIPAAIGIAILSYRLYDIDVVINRTLVYGALTVTLAAFYLALVMAFGLVLNPVTGESDLAVAGSTLAVAALFRPLRSRIQAIVDRRFYRSRYDAARTLAAFSDRLRHAVDLDALDTDLRDAVNQTMQPQHLSLWLPGRS
ncbi:MAG: putative two-component system sensor kinase [Nocardioidaceae bacterium]|jgi:hypothetical protein|nr:putative two-component system sensor kinase [Nocardioidaceae bacterium]